MRSGTFTWDEDDPHQGAYTVEWLPEAEREPVLRDLGISQDDF